MMPVPVRCGAASAAPPPFPEPLSAWASIDSGPNAIAVKIKAALAKGCRRNHDSLLPVCIGDLRALRVWRFTANPSTVRELAEEMRPETTFEASATTGRFPAFRAPDVKSQSSRWLPRRFFGCGDRGGKVFRKK